MAAAKTRNVVFILIPDFSNVGFACISAALTFCNKELGGQHFKLSYYSLDGRSVEATNGCASLVDGKFEDIEIIPDYLIVCGGSGNELYANEKFLSWLRFCERHGSHLVGLSTGSFGLASAGLLDGRRVSTHWRENIFQLLYPKVLSRRTHFEIDGNISTCSGGASAFDLIVHLIARELGETTAILVANEFQLERIRTKEDLQRGALLGTETYVSEVTEKALQIIEKEFGDKIKVSTIARRTGVTERHLHRLFVSELGKPPVSVIQTIRLRQAQQLLSMTTMSVSEIAYTCGFSSPSYFSQHYRREFGSPPSNNRSAFAQNLSKPDLV